MVVFILIVRLSLVLISVKFCLNIVKFLPNKKNLRKDPLKLIRKSQLDTH